MKIEWQNPPHHNVRGQAGGWPPLTDWIEVARQLKTRPGQWALVLHDVYRSHATRINNGSRMGFKDGQWQAKVIPQGEHPEKGDLYVRYLGPKDQ